MIWQELKKELVFPYVEASTYQDVMKEIGGKFIEKGYCNNTYVDALIEREEEYPTGLDIRGIGVAIPHTDVVHVKQAGIGIARLNQEVKFTQMGSDDDVMVRLVFMLAVDKPNDHLEHLQDILKIIQDKEILEKLLIANSAEEILNIIKEKEMEGV